MTDLIELARRWEIDLTVEMAAQFGIYRDMLLAGNEKINLTAITQPQEILEKHFLDSLILLQAYKIPQGARVIDVGTGAGFPGIPLKIVRPDIQLTLLDSLRKRVRFLEELSRELGQENAVIHARAEEAAHDAALRETFNLATARALAEMRTLSELCIPFVGVGGSFCALKGPQSAEEIENARNAISLLGGEEATPYVYDLPTWGSRVIYMINKSSQTPPKYPRKHKQMTKTPL